MDEQQFDELYHASYARLTVQLYAMIGDRDEAEECVQEAFARAWQHRRKMDRVDHPEAWLRTTAYRLAVSRWRRVVRGRRPPDRAVGAAVTTPGVTEDHVALVDALAKLPDAQREAIVLHHLADMSVDAVAQQLGTPTGTVKARLSRGRTALAALLQDGNGLEEGTSHA